MKNIILIVVFTLTITCKSQVLETVPINNISYNNGVYYKDMDNTFLYYIGTWKATQGNKEFSFEFVKFTQNLRGIAGSNNYSYHDELMIKYQVKDITSNQILYSDLNTTNFNDFKIKGLALFNGVFSFWYENREPNYCLNSIEFDLKKISGQPNQLLFCNLWYDFYDSEGCPYTNQQSIPSFLPTNDVIFTKQ